MNEIAGIAAIAALVWNALALFGAQVPKAWKPPLAGVLGVGLALLAFYTLDPAPYDSLFTALGVGMAGAAGASGIESYRGTYSKA